MAQKPISYDLEGQHISGCYELVRMGECLAVSVGFEGHSISAFVGQLRPDIVARTLLGELIRARLAEAADQRRPAARGTGPSGTAMPLHYRYGPIGSGATAG